MLRGREKGEKERRDKQHSLSRYFSADYYGPVTILGTKDKAVNKTNNNSDLIEFIF